MKVELFDGEISISYPKLDKRLAIVDLISVKLAVE